MHDGVADSNIPTRVTLTVRIKVKLFRCILYNVMYIQGGYFRCHHPFNPLLE